MGTSYKEALFNKMPIVGILRNAPLETIEAFLPAYKKAGLTTLEITMNSDNVSEIIGYLSKNHPDLNIGAGTVCTMEDLKKALTAGASFIVTPIIDDEVISYCKNHKIPVFPGAFTPSEIYNAAKLGATAVKVFPATQLGAGYIKDVLAPLNHLKLLPTGGVSLENIESFFKAGAMGVGMGGTLFDKKFIEKKDYDGLYSHFKAICDKVTKSIQG
tara:strand:- start:4497 stop:5141 length:645 start_codon:yes stop_codon:yes gene_type:complete